MKKLLLLLAFPFSVHAASPFDFKIDNISYELFDHSVTGSTKGGVTQVTALWQVGTAENSSRWRVVVTGCDKSSGGIGIFHPTGTLRYDWVQGGSYAYDYLAVISCFLYDVQKPVKLSK